MMTLQTILHKKAYVSLFRQGLFHGNSCESRCCWSTLYHPSWYSLHFTSSDDKTPRLYSMQSLTLKILNFARIGLDLSLCLCVLNSPCVLTPAVATKCLDSQPCDQVSFPISQRSKPLRPGRDLLPKSPNQVRSKTEHEDEVTSQQDIWRGTILQAGLLVLLIEVLALVSLCL